MYIVTDEYPTTYSLGGRSQFVNVSRALGWGVRLG